jgi:hypothetical protein
MGERAGDPITWPVTFRASDGRWFTVRRSAPPNSLLILEVDGQEAPFVMGGYAGEQTSEAVIHRTLHWWAEARGKSFGAAALEGREDEVAEPTRPKRRRSG